MTHPLWVPDRVADADRAALGDAEQGEPVQPGRIHNDLQVTDERVQGELVRMAVRQAAAALVVAHDLMGPPEFDPADIAAPRLRSALGDTRRGRIVRARYPDIRSGGVISGRTSTAPCVVTGSRAAIPSA